jgi:hypothetical protein
VNETSLPELVQAMLDPGFYPHTPPRVELVQTQMSFVFLAGEYVYKVKKAVDLGYLDYTTLDKREFFCGRELELNTRLSPHIYLEVVPIVRRGGAFALGGDGEVAEYAVKMRRLPQERMMDELLRQDKVSGEMVRQVARKMADFHCKAETSEEIASYGRLDAILINIEENSSQTEKYIGNSISRERYQDIQAYNDEFISENTSLFESRVECGRIKDCHGDLHAAHICFINDIAIYDCIEFSDRFRYGDTASEMAFLAMDLDYHGHPELSRCLIESYVEVSSDPELIRLLDFYKCYRACVRGKVESFKLDDPHIPQSDKKDALARARRYFALAHSYTGKGRVPALVIVCGLVGTGKSTVAEMLAKEEGWQVISSDVTRKSLAGIPLMEHRFEEFDGGIYSREFSEMTYACMFDESREVLSRGSSMIIDASFKKKEERDEARKLAEEMGARFLVVECTLDEETARLRLDERLREGSISDGRWEIFGQQQKDFDEIGEIPPESHMVLDTSGPVEDVVSSIIERIGG